MEGARWIHVFNSHGDWCVGIGQVGDVGIKVYRKATGASLRRVAVIANKLRMAKVGRIDLLCNGWCWIAD